jgi:hypothetical protein
MTQGSSRNALQAVHKSEDPDPWHVGVRKQVTRITQLPDTGEADSCMIPTYQPCGTGEADSYMIPTCQPCGRECTTQQDHSAVPLHVDVTSEPIS